MKIICLHPNLLRRTLERFGTAEIQRFQGAHGSAPAGAMGPPFARTLRSSASPSVQQCPRIARLGARAVPPRARPTLPPRRAKPCCNPCKEAGPPVSRSWDDAHQLA